MKHKLLLLSKLFDAGRALIEDSVECIDVWTNDVEAAIKEHSDVQGIFLGNQKLPADVMDLCPNLRLIAKQGSGFDNIDVAHATKKGIPVVISSGVNATSVAEHVMMLTLAVNRNLLQYDEAVRSGNFSYRTSGNARECNGKTMGLVGFGSIGQEVAKFATALGMKLVFYDPFFTGDYSDIAQAIDFDTLIRTSDIVSLHVPLTDATKGMIGHDEISKMKNGAMVINCSRGGVVDEEALYHGLVTGHVWGAGIDVFSQEPVNKDNKLLTLDNVIVTPHSAALTKESSDGMSTETAKGILAVFNNEQWVSVANPKIYNKRV